MKTVEVTVGTWRLGHVLLPETFGERLKGLRGRPPGTAMLLETSSVHGIGMREAFRAVGITGTMQVGETRMVAPGQVVRIPGCRYILELPSDIEPPLTGQAVEVRCG